MANKPVVLVVEDNPKNMRLVKDILIFKGFEVLQAENGNDGIDIARSHRPDLIIMDIQMPGMDGLTATRQLKGDPQTSAIPVIALTAMAMKGDREKILEAGCDNYLQKPIKFDDLVTAVKDHT